MIYWLFGIICFVFLALLVTFLYVIKRFVFWTSNIDYIRDILNDYSNHLNIILEMETYSGEPVIENLLKNTKFVSNKVKDFVEIVDFFIEEETMEEKELNEEKKEGE